MAAGVDHVSGDMFESVPGGDAILMKVGQMLGTKNDMKNHLKTIKCRSDVFFECALNQEFFLLMFPSRDPSTY